jgi:hypothetical protein
LVGVSTGSIGVDAREVLVLAEAAQENTIDVGSGGIVLATDTIEDVLAVTGGVGACGVACLKAEGSSTHKVVPFDSLDEVSTIAEGLGEEKGTERVTTLIGTMGVELSSGIILSDVDELLLDETSDLDVIGGLHELQTCDGALGDDTSAIAGLCAPSDTFALDVTDEGVGFGGTPKAEVIDAVDDSGLAQRGRALGSAVANIVASLCTTFTSSGVCSVGESSVGKVPGGKRSVRLCEGDGQKARNECDGSKDGRHFNRQN